MLGCQISGFMEVALVFTQLLNGLTRVYFVLDLSDMMRENYGYEGQRLPLLY